MTRQKLQNEEASNNIDDHGLEVEVTTGLIEDDFVRINVCGMMYETLKPTLERFPSTLLGNIQRRKDYYVKSKNAYFFDCNRQCFEAILYYYQSSGLLIRPSNVPMNLFAKEISFFELGEEAFTKLQENEKYNLRLESDKSNKLGEKRSRHFVGYSDYSIWTNIIISWFGFVILLIVTAIILETLRTSRIDRT